MNRLLKSSFTGLSLALGLLVASATPAQAGFKAWFEDVGPNVGNAGQYNWNTGATTIPGVVYTANGNGSNYATHFVAFCLQRNQNISSNIDVSGNNVGLGNAYAFAPLSTAPQGPPSQPPMGANADNIARMWKAWRSDVNGNNVKSAAFQWAVWFFAGSATMSEVLSQGGGVGSQANTYITTGWNSGSAKANLVAMVNSSLQDQVLEINEGYTPDDEGDLEPAPAPAGLVLALFGIAPCVALRRRLLGTKAAE